MELNLKDLNCILQNTHIKYSNANLKLLFKDSKDKYFKFLKPILENPKYNGIEKSTLEEHNPLLWEAGHPIFFIEKHCLRYLYPENDYPYKPDKFYNNLYDSFVIPIEFRSKVQLPSFNDITIYYLEIQEKIIRYLDSFPDDQMNPTYYYMLMLVLLHLHMHLESYLFTNQLTYKVNPFIDTNLKITIEEPVPLEFIKIEGGTFWQGYFDKCNKIGFDNEKPSFKSTIDTFLVSKTLITNHMFVKFIEEGGYFNDSLWSFNGKLWKNNKLLNNSPLYWKKLRGEWYIDYFDKLIKLKNIGNYPVIHISWYEAEAFAKWKGCRLITESEWEYIATNKSESYYPWGDSEEKLKDCNLDYNQQWITSVNYNSELTKNNWGVTQLIGNCWEWCQENIYPYDKFTIDPLYREMSYPFFGYNKICKGGSWCVPNYLITSSYRNAQSPDTRKQYIGFRLAK